MDGAAPGQTVISKCRPLEGINEAGTEGFLREFFKRFFGAHLSRYPVKSSPYYLDR